MLTQFCLEKELCVSSTWFKGVGERKVTLKVGENEKEIYFELTKKQITDGLCET